MKLANIWKEEPHSLSVFIMAYNEVDNLEFVFNEVHEECERSQRPYEIMIVDDGSMDGTSDLADRLASTVPQARVIHHGANKGIGQVLRTGFDASSNDLVTFFPADGQYPAEIINQFLPHMPDYDIVLGYVPRRDSAFMAKLLSRCERILLHMLFGRIPPFQGIYMFRRSLLRLFPLTSMGRGWIIQMELIIRAKRAGCRMTSLPTGMRRRLSGESKARNFKSVIANMKQVFQLFWRLRWSR